MSFTKITPIESCKTVYQGIMRAIFPQETLVHPCQIDGKNAIVYEKDLDKKNPSAYVSLKNFARINGIHLKEDQRNSFQPVQTERRSKLLPMMVLGASLFGMKPVLADSEHDGVNYAASQNSSIFAQHYESKFNATGLTDVEELLEFISNETRSLDANFRIPNIERVSSNEMLKVAFGGKLPKNVNMKSLQIYGLYNYKNKSIYLLNEIDLATDAGKAILLHELVHYLQYENGHDKHAQCKNQLERLAYNLEAKFLKHNRQRVSFSSAHVERVSRCG